MSKTRFRPERGRRAVGTEVRTTGFDAFGPSPSTSPGTTRQRVRTATVAVGIAGAQRDALVREAGVSAGARDDTRVVVSSRCDE